MLRRAESTPPDSIGEELKSAISRNDQVFLTGVIYQELLQGLRNERQREVLITRLAPFGLLQPNRATHERAARLADKCLRNGVTVATIDVLIAQIAIECHCRLLARDGDFDDIARVEQKLKLLPEGH